MKKYRTCLLILLICMAASLICGCLRIFTDPDQPESRTGKKDKTYHIAVEGDNAPYYFTDGQGKAQGIYVDIMDAISQKEGFAYTFVEMDAADYTNVSNEGEVTCFMGVLNETPGEEKLITSEPFLKTKIAVVLRKEKAGTVESMADLRTCNVAARAYSGENDLADFLAYKYETIPAIFSNETIALEDFAAGLSEAVVLDKKYYKAHKEENMVALYTSENYENLHRFSFSDRDDRAELLIKAVKTINVPEEAGSGAE